MNRKNIPDGTGMLFVFEYDQILSFWMKNTPTPFSIAFITKDGKIKDIFYFYSVDLDSDRNLKIALHKFKKNFVIQILDCVSWNQTEASKIMGIQRTYLSKLMSDLDIRK